ncbi:MAG: DUF2490 domain-containing protein [Planctomycetia bacterium]|nr:DUF2490 domain-containing protein [Planctomycetia bacterium]
MTHTNKVGPKLVNILIKRCTKIVLHLFIYFLIVFPIDTVFSQNDSTTSKTLITAQPGLGLRINYNNKFQLSQDSRLYYNTTDRALSYEEFSLSAKYYIGKINNFNFTTTLSYLHTLNDNFKTIQYRPKYYFSIVYRKDRLRIGIRNRFEYIIKTGNNSGSTFRYRPRFKLGLVYKLQHIRLYPYVYNELFFSANGFDQYRIKLALAARYNNFQFSVGNLFKVKTNNGFVEDRISLELNYRIKIKNDRTFKPKEGIGVDPLYP